MNNERESSPAPAPEPTPPPQAAPAPAPAAPSGAPTLQPAAPAPARQRPRLIRLARLGALAVGTLAALTAIFYAEENWRGGSAWDTAKKKLEAQQEKMDWAAYVPPPAPDDQNFFKAPKMQDWFTGKGTNELTARLSLNSFAELAWHRSHSNATVTVTELILRWPTAGRAPSGADAPPPAVVPVISLDQATVGEAILQLAGQAKLKVDIDPRVIAGRPGPDGKPVPPARITGQWTNVSALSVLMALLSDNNLRWVDDPKTGLALIKDADVSGLAGGGETTNREYLLVMIRAAIGPIGEVPDNFPVSGKALRDNPPWRISIAPDTVPTQNELARFLPGARALRVEPAGNSLRVLLNVTPVAAADYLVWSDQFSPEFDKIREAVKRPAARLDGDYQQLCLAPEPNLTAVSVAASRLASRAKSFLMRGQPGDALRELTLLNDLRGCVEGKPAGRPMTLGWAMADVSMAALCAETISDGLRLQLWHDSELAALQDQLSRMDLVSAAWSALEARRAGDCHLLETGSRAEAARVFGIGAGKTNFWQKIKSPPKMALKFMPRGWLCQNMAHLAVMDQDMIDSVDRLQDIIHPHLAEDAAAQISGDVVLHHRSFYWFLVKNIMAYKIQPTLASLRTTALAQAAVNQALVVCALERCRLARGEYPATLHDLVPQFIPLLPLDPINGGPLKYRTAGPGRFLLYSIGWDEMDDNGAPLDSKGKGDWVWGRQ